MNRSVLSDCVHKEQHSDGVISELINFLHKSLPEHDPDEQVYEVLVAGQILTIFAQYFKN